MLSIFIAATIIIAQLLSAEAFCPAEWHGALAKKQLEKNRSLRLIQPLSLSHSTTTATTWKNVLLQSTLNNDSDPDNHDGSSNRDGRDNNALTLVALAAVSLFYWYWLVLGAAAKANGLPGIPDFLPMVPGWPPTAQDLQGPLDDIPHFFYLSELLGNTDAPYAPPTRLAVYNIAEAWIFAFLPALWKDPLRLPRPILLGLWAVLGINLTNAFLAPYLFVTAVLGGSNAGNKNQAVTYTMGTIATAVASFAVFQTLTQTTFNDWVSFWQTCQQDRTYFAFCVDLILFSLFQPYILKRADGSNRPLDFVPFVGLVAWLFR